MNHSACSASIFLSSLFIKDVGVQGEFIFYKINLTMRKITCFMACMLMLTSFSLFSQNVIFSGKVMAKSSNEPLIGANVYFKGTTLGTSTNGRGEFSIGNVKSGEYEVVVSYSGYEHFKKHINIDEQNNTLNVSLGKSDKALGEVVITATGTPHHLKSVPVQTEMISKKMVKGVAASTFSDLLSGVSPSFDFAPNTMGSFMQLNGLGNDYILVLVDGKRLYGDIGGQSDLNRINPDDIERVEVVKGASSSLYGSEAIAGVINVITKQSKRKVSITNNSRLGEYGTWQQNNKVTLNVGRLSSTTSYSRKESDGWQLSKFENKKGEVIPTEAQAMRAFNDHTISQKLEFAPTQKLKLYLMGSKYEKDVTMPQSVKKYDYYYDDMTYSGGAKFLLNKTDHISLDYNSDRFRYYYKYNQDYKSYVDGEKALNTDQKRNDVNLKYVFSLQKIHQVSVGSEYVNETLTSEGRLNGDDADAYTFSAFAQDEIRLIKDFSLVAGVRYVSHKEFGSAFTPKVSALYKIKDVNLRASYAKGFKAPTLKELYYHYERKGTLYLGNTNLDPQTSDYYSFSAEYVLPKVSFSASVYRNNVKDLIAYKSVTTSVEDEADGVTSTRQNTNIGEARTQGVDVLFNVNVGAGFTFGGGYSYVDARNQTDDIRLDGVANNYGNVRLVYDRSWKNYFMNVCLLGRFQDDKFYDDTKGDAKGYGIWKLTTSHRFAHVGDFNLEATAGIDNIFDRVDERPYGVHYATLNPGRTFFVGVNIRFDK